MQLKFHMATGQWAKASTEYERIIAKASTGAVRDVGKSAVQAGRERISGAGFSQKFARTLVIKFRPPTGISLDPSAYIHSTVNYADVFETGKTIQAKTYLWLPLPSVPSIKGRPHMTPKQYIQNVGPLVLMWRPGKAPLLGAQIRRAPKPQPFGKFATRRILTRGTSGRGTLETIPLFVGVKSITIPKKFDVHGAIKNAAKELPQRYIANLDPYEGRK